MVDARARKGDYIQVRSGGAFWPLDPRPEEVRIEDIAHALSNQCRFSGHTSSFYSVAQHSVLVSRHCDPADALWGLLHDAAEAYCVDLPRPIKQDPSMLAYREAEAAIMYAVCGRFRLPMAMPASVHDADNRMLVAEIHALMNPDPAIWRKWWLGVETTGIVVEPVGPAEAGSLFLARWEELATHGAVNDRP